MNRTWIAIRNNLIEIKGEGSRESGSGDVDIMGEGLIL